MNRRRRGARSGYAIATAGTLLVLALASCSASSTPQSVPVGSAESRAPSAASTIAPASVPVGAGGDSAEPTMIPTALPTASVSAEETPVMGGPGDGGSGSGSPEPSLGRDEELESRLPQTLNGQPVDIESSLGSDMSPDADPTLKAFLDALGAAQADMSVATGWSTDGSWDGQVSALRVRGAQADRILAAFIDAAGASSEAGLTVTNESIGGREVVRIVDRDSPEQGPMYAVAVGDTVYFVQSPTMSIVSEALAAFPS